jgi:CRP-like cAMP-binding protein
MEMVTFTSVLGVAGVVAYLAAYGALQLGLIRGQSQTYTLLNLGAASAVLISLFDNWNAYSAAIQIFWIGISLLGLWQRFWLRRKLSFSPEETAFLAEHLPTVPPIEAFRLIRIGRWVTADPGAQITIQGQPVGALLYLAEGTADVVIDGAHVAELGPGALIGEMTLIHGRGATADVTITAPARLFLLPRERLMKEMGADPELAVAIGHALEQEVQRKLRSIEVHRRTLQNDRGAAQAETV